MVLAEAVGFVQRVEFFNGLDAFIMLMVEYDFIEGTLRKHENVQMSNLFIPVNIRVPAK